MNTLDDFVTLLQDELGLDVTTENVGLPFDRVPGWDSVHMLSLVVVLERETARRVSLPDLLEAPSLQRVFDLVTLP
ncbi:acyl carrier protein [Kitasatospora sp. NPDC057692]|uniref:acyl carrier protein n=1 Tax=unclassified Kitasatospora TaxID=2633591 RepID=UPI0035E28925